MSSTPFWFRTSPRRRRERRNPPAVLMSFSMSFHLQTVQFGMSRTNSGTCSGGGTMETEGFWDAIAMKDSAKMAKPGHLQGKGFSRRFDGYRRKQCKQSRSGLECLGFISRLPTEAMPLEFAGACELSRAEERSKALNIQPQARRPNAQLHDPRAKVHK